MDNSAAFDSGYSLSFIKQIYNDKLNECLESAML